MLLSPASVLLLVFLRGSPVAEPSAAACEDLQRVELSRSSETTREVCVSPGFMTGFLFDLPVSVELQDEVRFVEVTRGRIGVSLVPPGDMAPGERLRLTVSFVDGQSVTFILVAHRGRATHQVEVFHDERTRESYLQEVDQEHAKNQRLREQNQRLLQENEQLREQLDRNQGLRPLIAGRFMGNLGIRVLVFKERSSKSSGGSNGDLSPTQGIGYRSLKTVAAEVMVLNSGTESWMVAGGSLVGANGEELKGLRFRQEEAIAPNQDKPVIVEADASKSQAQGEMTLRLWDARGRSVSIPKVRFP